MTVASGRQRTTSSRRCKATHLFVLQQAYKAYQFAQTQIAACDREVEAWLKQTEKTVDIREHPLPSETGRRKKARDNEPTCDARSYVYEIYGVDVTQIPGIQAATVQIMLAEVGRDLTKWPTEKHFTSWLGLCPNFKRSGGKDYSSQTRKVQSRAAKALPYRDPYALDLTVASEGFFAKNLYS